MPKKLAVKKKYTKDNITVDLYNPNGDVIGKIDLDEKIFNVDVNSTLLAQAVRIYLGNQRSGTHSTKTRSFVRGSTRKIYRQKGTGKARHGDIKAPIFIGGGIAHGPLPRDYRLSLPKKMRKIALFGALTDKYREKKIVVVDGLEDLPLKSKELYKTLLNLKLFKNNKLNEKILLVLPGKNERLYLSGRNMENLTIKDVKLLNPYEVMIHTKMLFMKDALTNLQRNLKLTTDEKNNNLENSFSMVNNTDVNKRIPKRKITIRKKKNN